ncbi:hypothetical protein APHAL10511_002667 [Amanita phalloides]|nr:hypothetical protein APHAL10511_002667 [Amanita phalloides]
MIGISVVAFMMFLRIRCLYQQRKRVYYCVGILFLIQTGLYAYLLTRGQPVRHPDGSPIKACTMIFDPKISGLATSSAWMPLLYDTIVFLLTLHRVLRSKSNMFGTSLRFDLQNRLFEDGLIYYCAIFAVNLVLTVMIAVAPPGLKNITAQLELLVTVMMMSRITLNLKKAGAKGLEGMHRIEEMSRAIRFATPEVHQLEPLYDGKRMTERRSPLGSTFIPREQSPESSL